MTCEEQLAVCVKALTTCQSFLTRLVASPLLIVIGQSTTLRIVNEALTCAEAPHA